MTTVTVHVTMMRAMIVFMARMIVIETVIMMVAAIHAPESSIRRWLWRPRPGIVIAVIFYNVTCLSGAHGQARRHTIHSAMPATMIRP